MNDTLSMSLDNWIPYRLYNEGGKNNCRWLYLGDKKFTEPFFDDTILCCKKLPENSKLIKSVSSMEVLPGWAQQVENIAPTAFIFHVSRCGSTLISQMLAEQPANIVLSEVPFFDELLRYGKKQHCMPDILPQLQAAIGLYSAKRNEKQQHLFIKADSWHIHFYKELRDLYPTVPFFLLYRKPDEVLRSQQKNRGMQAIPNFLEAAIFGFNEQKIAAMTLDEYMGMVIESYLNAFLEILQKDRSAYPINYHDGAMKIVDTIAAVTGLQIPETEKILMQTRAGFHAKFPKQVFSEKNPGEPVPGFLKRSFELYDLIEVSKAGIQNSF